PHDFSSKLLARCAFSEPMNGERETCCVRKMRPIPANAIVPCLPDQNCSVGGDQRVGSEDSTHPTSLTETKTLGSEFADPIHGFGRPVFLSRTMHVSKTGQPCFFRVVGLFARLGNAAGLAFLDGASLAGHHPRRRIRFPSGKYSQPARG